MLLSVVRALCIITALMRALGPRLREDDQEEALRYSRRVSSWESRAQGYSSHGASIPPLIRESQLFSISNDLLRVILRRSGVQHAMEA